MDKLRSLSSTAPLFPAERATVAAFLRKQSIKVLWLALLAGIACSSLFALDPRQPLAQLYHSSWNSRNGLIGSVTALAQTTDGFLWVGTSAGLFRFDGLYFEQYRPEAGSLPSNSVTALMAVPDGGLWIGFVRGGASFLKGARITNYSADRFYWGAVRCFAQDPTGAVWAATVGALARFEDGSWQKIGTNWNYPSKSAEGLFVDRDGTLWVAAIGRIMFLPLGQKHFADLGLAVGQIMAIAQAPDGAIVFIDNDRHGLTALRHSADGKNDLLPGVDVAARAIVFDRDGGLWVGGLGLDRLPMAGLGPSKSRAGVERLRRAQGLTDDEVTSILEDREGNIWVATDGGLDRFRHRNLSWFPVLGNRFSLVSGVHGQVWVGPREGDSGPISESNDLVRDGPRDSVMAYRDPDGTIWFSTVNVLLHLVDGKYTKIDLPEQVRALSRSTIPNDPIIISSITKDRSGKLWVSFAGSGEFYLENGAWNFVRVLPDHPDWSANYAFTDSSDRVWLAWGEEIAVLDHGKVRILSTKDDLEVGPPNIIAEYDRHVWVGGQYGLAFLQGDRFHTLHTADGVGLESISGIATPPGGGLWLSTGLGIVHIPESEIRRSLEHDDQRVSYELFDLVSDLPEQLQQSKTWSSEAVQSDDNALWFAMRNGVARVDPARIVRNPLPPPVTIRSVIADEKSYSPLTSPRLPALTRNLEISYTALSLSVPERVRFRYKLEGSKNKWTEAGPRRQVYYTDLGPGRYTFRVIACNNDGVWNEEGATLDFSVAPAWYQTIWFRVSCAGGFVLLLWFLYQLRLQQLRLQFNMTLEARVGERTRIARELHDTLLQSFQGLMLRFQAVDEMLPVHPMDAKKALEGALDRGDQAISEGRDAITHIRAPVLTSHDLAKSIAALMDNLSEEFGEGNGTSIMYRVLVQGAPRIVHPALPGEIYRIARESLRNAFRHAQARQIETEIIYGESLCLRFRDDGKGIDPSVVERGGRPGHWGLPGIRERARQIGAHLEVWSELGAGTEVELSIPGSIAYKVSPAKARFRIFPKRMEQDYEQRS
jgi:signal transduction histidine kinase/ligand-binding sensor domain-containing protein